MLTVLIKYRISKTETVHEVKSAEFYPLEGTHPPGLLLRYDDGRHTHLDPTPEGDEDWRDVFVMNSNGQTVTRYTL